MLNAAGQKIRDYRHRHDPVMRQSQFGTKFDISGSYVSALELGEKLPSAKLQQRFQQEGVCEPNDWFEPALCPTCERRIDDPVLRACTRAGCPRVRSDSQLAA